MRDANNTHTCAIKDSDASENLLPAVHPLAPYPPDWRDFWRNRSWCRSTTPNVWNIFLLRRKFSRKRSSKWTRSLGSCIRAAFSGEREFRRVVCKKCFQVVLRDVDGSLENHESLYAQIKEQVKRRLRETHNINIKSMLIGSKSWVFKIQYLIQMVSSFLIKIFERKSFDYCGCWYFSK